MNGEITWFGNNDMGVEWQKVDFAHCSPSHRTRQRMLDWFTSVIDGRGDLSALVAGNVMDKFGFRGKIKSDIDGEIVGEFALNWEGMK